MEEGSFPVRASGGYGDMVTGLLIYGGILTALLGMPGLQMSQAVSDACTLACAIPIQLRVLRQMSAMPEATLPSA